ncbi:MAG: BlaI/MecI/CopY family transcriptional regulator [Chloroflexi bacterium]|nr:BlaI/MecI/CopY family transcriptional regulator [Chloroflexota bacterium]
MKEDQPAKFLPHRSGLAKVLGPREAEIMEIVWSQGTATVGEVQARLLGSQPAYTTVMTIMGRLVRKGLLRRSKQGGLYSYSATVGRGEWVQSMVSGIINGLFREFAEPALVHFLRRLEGEDEAILAQVERIIKERKETS